MMPPGPSAAELFVSRVHRRRVAVLAAERAGLGTLAGCVAAVLLLPLLLCLGRSPVVPMTETVAGGAGVGLLWGLVRRPRRLGAAAAADRQFGLHDLLATAITLPDTQDPWTRTVRAKADASCRKLSPAAVVLHQFGARAWGGIGSAVAMVLALGLLVSPLPLSRAAGEAEFAGGDKTPGRADPPDRPLLAAADAARRTARPGRDNDSSADHPLVSTSDAMPADAPSTPPDSADGGPSRNPAAGDSGGGSRGSSQTRPPADTPPRPEARSVDAGGARPFNPSGPTAGGAGRQGTPTEKNDGIPSGTVAAGTGGPPPAPPWQTAGWAADAGRAHDALQGGQVAPAYRDLVRQYFDRP